MLPALLLELALLGAPARSPEVAALRAFAAASPRPPACRPAPLLDENGLWERTRGGVMERHDHAICNQCGKLVDLDMPEAAKLMPAAARKSRFKPQSVHLTLRGVCPDCCGSS